MSPLRRASRGLVGLTQQFAVTKVGITTGQSVVWMARTQERAFAHWLLNRSAMSDASLAHKLS